MRNYIYINNKKLAILVLGLVELRLLKLGIVVGSDCGILRRKEEKKNCLECCSLQKKGRRSVWNWNLLERLCQIRWKQSLVW